MASPYVYLQKGESIGIIALNKARALDAETAGFAAATWVQASMPKHGTGGFRVLDDKRLRGAQGGCRITDAQGAVQRDGRRDRHVLVQEAGGNRLPTFLKAIN